MIWAEKKYERNGVETIVDNDGTLWLNKEHIEVGLDHKMLQVATVKFLSDYEKHRHELEN